MKPLLSKEESERIAAAVAEAEEKSGGEIATAVIAESDNYGFQELAFGVIAGFITFTLAALLDNAIKGFFASLIWNFNPGLLPFIYSWFALFTGALAFFLAQIPAVDRLIVSKRVMAATAQARARRHFIEAGVHDTLDHTGILIFVSLLERRVELIADRGINEKVDPEIWNSIVTKMISKISAGELTEAMVDAVHECGDILAEKIERRQNDNNELKNAPEELERGS